MKKNSPNIILLLIISFAGTACSKETKPETARVATDTTVVYAKQSKLSEQEQAAIQKSVLSFMNWYKEHYDRIFSFQEVVGGTGKDPLKLNMMEVENLLREWTTCPFISTNFVDLERGRYAQYAEEWKKQAPKELPLLLQIDPYLCNNEPDMVFSLLEEATVVAAKGSQSSDALLTLPNGTRILLEVELEGEEWKIRRVKCQ